MGKFRVFRFPKEKRWPLWIRKTSGPLLGGLIGLLGGIPGLIIGIILGFLLRTIISQFQSDHEISMYYESPGASRFYEGEPGLAAFCGLGILLSGSGTGDGEAGLLQTARIAREVFPGADSALIDHFCRLALLRLGELNPDLLAESLASKRKPFGDLPSLGFSLYSLAREEKYRELAERIRLVLDPSFRGAAEAPLHIENEKEDPWKILGLSQDTPFPEVKSHFRRLAMQFHPDELQALDNEHRETAARAFIKLEQAYKEICDRTEIFPKHQI